MLLLGGGCPQLTQLHAEFDLRGMPESAEARTAAGSVEYVGSLRSGLTSELQQALLLAENTRQQQQLQLEVLQQRFGAAGQSSPSSSGWPPLAHVSVTGGCSTANLAKLLQSCPQLQQLSLDGLGPLGDAIAATLACSGQQLKVLQISGCSSMTKDGCSVLAAWLQQLQQLDLVDVSLPADHLGVLLERLGRGFEDHPDAAGNANSSSSSSRRLTHLRRLKIERCRGMTNDVITSSLTKLQHLQQLQLVACDNIQGDSALLSLLELLPQLSVLEVVGCKEVADAGFARRWEAAAAARVRDNPGCRVAVQRVVWQA
jgi:hypothetical protein